MGWLIFIAILAAAAAALCIWETSHFKVVRYVVNAKKLQKSHRFVFISDLHSCCYGSNNEKLVRAVLDLEPEAVLIGGDMLVGKKGADGNVALAFLEQLTGKMPIYYVNGNHESRMHQNPEYFGDGYQLYLHGLEQLGIILLNDRSIPYPNDEGLQLSGVELEDIYYQKRKRAVMESEVMQRKLGKPDCEKFQLLLAHSPAYSRQYAQWGANLVLAGHYHGGIVGLPGNRGLISTQYKLFEKCSRGIFSIGKDVTGEEQNMIVSAGMGTHTIKVRLFNPQQLICLDLKKD